MAVSIAVSAKIFARVKCSTWKGQGVQGFVLGKQTGQCVDDLEVIGVWRTEVVNRDHLKEEINSCLAHFPCGTQVVGLVCLPPNNISKSKSESEPEEFAHTFIERNGDVGFWLEKLGLSKAVILCVWLSGGSSVETNVFLMSSEGFSLVTMTEPGQTRPSVKMRLKGKFPLTLSTESTDKNVLKCELQHELTRLQRYLQAGDLVYGLDNNSVLLQSGGALASVTGQPCRTCGELLKNLAGSENVNKGKVGKQQQTHESIPVSVLLRVSTESSNDNHHAPIIRHQTGSLQSIQVYLPIDLLVDVEENLLMFDLYNILTDAVLRQVNVMFDSLNSCIQNDGIKTPEVLHFHPECLDTPITVVYPYGMSEEQLEKQRQTLHQHLCLPIDKPLLRRGAAGLFLSTTAPGGYLLNTHVGLSQPSVKSGTVCTVSGYYSYHHYMQDRFDDDKWGCAYRSLQTLISWFKYQGYTEKNIPSHREIQKALVDIGDKEDKFIGSRQWIGSFEVSYVLDHLLGVTSKFINVNAGSELSTVGQQLAHHFLTQGTPVMIGGGVLAHTILGVAYCELTGDINFLILDPHYTGGEDLRTIQDKGWCGWKDMKFWNQMAHYNMCLPQLPQCL